MDTSNRSGSGEKNMRIRLVIGSLIALAAVAPLQGETPLSTAFTYQGQLKQGGAPPKLVSDEEVAEIAELMQRLSQVEAQVQTGTEQERN
jgi:hypothetical protein